MTLKAEIQKESNFMATSISIRKINEFSIPEGKTEVKKAKVPLGSIIKSANTLNISGLTFDVFDCTYSKDISDDITVFIRELEDYKELDTYKKQFSFKMYYSESKKLLFSSSTTPITKAFLKALSNTDGVDLGFDSIHFDLDDISNMFGQTKGVRFSSTDQGVNSKSLSGYQVDINPEALTALENDDATQIIGAMDIGQQSYTIMLTQSGTIMSFSKLIGYEKFEIPMLSFAIDVLKKINYLK
ncbi:hypothetical protein FC26_GL000796 [Paucilactobacillus vaccinostercus DSM 20634]|uniref:Uncharacterized protein n=2 Tax=Paucilactobacillus vaccinostercus TaxID=176291 RepID=A0A0R2AG93_9LACO|nr:hypothetical protein FC26_GL000796 [Paucilactobacillus vaccinostercus DSM 20634]